MPTRNNSTEPTPVAINELSHRHKIGILAICCTSLFIVGIDITAVNIALPSIGRQLNAGITGLQWTVDAYTVVLASLLMLSGSVADRFGRKRTFITGLTVFSIGSMLCSLAPTVGLLVAFRALQAVGASMLNPVAMSIITNTFTNPRERAQAVGIWGAVFGISMALGPVIGGTLVSTIGWRAIFLINIPIGLSAIILTSRFIPESKAPRPRRFDPVAQMLVIVGLASMTYAIIEAPIQGWSSPTIVAVFAASAAAFLALVVYEPRRHEPLIELRFFRSIPFTTSVITSVAAFAAFGGFLFLNTLYLQEVRDLSADPRRTRDPTYGDRGDDHLAALRAHRRPPRSAHTTRYLRCRAGDWVGDADRDRSNNPSRPGLRGVHRVRDRVRVRQRADHQRRRIRHAARAKPASPQRSRQPPDSSVKHSASR